MKSNALLCAALALFAGLACAAQTPKPLFEASDFGEEFTPELREREDKMRAEIANLTKTDVG